MTRKRILGLICIAAVGGLLWLGLWPFRRPRNDAAWLNNQNGVRLSGYGTIVSADSFRVSASEETAASSLEIWVEPALTIDTSTLLAFSTSQYPLQFAVQQHLSALLLKQRIRGDTRHRAAVGVAGVFHEGKSVFVTITSGPGKTSVYIDGRMAGTFPDFRLGTDFTGRLVIGTSPVRTDGWLGKVKGLATYDRELPPDSVRKHFESWTTRGTPELDSVENLKTLYLFDDRMGGVVHNSAKNGPDLYIPKRFSLVQQPFLKPFWEEYTADWGYLRDTMLNVVGFVPLGFLLFAYWRFERPTESATIATIAVGLAVSLTIEVVQWYLPTRNSGTTDLFTNTLGTFLGAQIHRIPSVERLLARLP